MSTKKICIIDTETAGELSAPLVYDYSGIIADLHGKIYDTFAIVNTDIFFNDDLMNSAYYGTKRPLYESDLKRGKYSSMNNYTARRYILDMLVKYKVKDIYAYNMYFDRAAMNSTFAYCTNNRYRYFFPKGFNFFCIWAMATQTICQKKAFYDWCINHNLLSSKGDYLSTNAETVYSFMKQKTDFKEEHRGLADCKIEYEILLECLKSHKKINREIDRLCWRKVTRFHEEKGRTIPPSENKPSI